MYEVFIIFMVLVMPYWLAYPKKHVNWVKPYRPEKFEKR